MSNSLLSLFTKEWPWANHSHHSLKKSDLEQIALVTLYKIATVSKSLSLLFKKSDMSDLLKIQANLSQKKEWLVIHSKNSYFCMFLIVFHCFSPFLCPRANPSRRSSLSRSFSKSDGSDFSCCSLQKTDCERIALLLTKTSDSLEKLTSEFPTLHDSSRIWPNLLMNILEKPPKCLFFHLKLILKAKTSCC